MTIDERLALTLALMAAQRERHEAQRALRALYAAEARRRVLNATLAAVDIPELVLKRLSEAQERCAAADHRIHTLVQAARGGSAV